MQEHSAIGERILREVAAYDDIATIVRHHHERIDGHGYPDGIIGANIPTGLEDHRSCRCVQRHDLGSAVPSCDGLSGGARQTPSGHGQSIPYGRGGCVPFRAVGILRGIPLRSRARIRFAGRFADSA